MKKLLLLLLIIYCSCLCSQKTRLDLCDCSSVLILKNVKVPIYKGLNHDNGADFIIDDTLKEDYFTIIIKQQLDSFFFVSASAVKDTLERKGWIKAKNLGIYPNSYSKSIFLYSLPNENSKIKSKIAQPEYYPLNILKCKDKWLYVQYLDVDKVVKEGWLSPKNQCSNPYTTCN